MAVNTYITRRLKDPNATIDHTLDWGTQWLATGDTILTSTWIVASGLTKSSESNTTLTTTVWLTGGTDGEDYEVTNRITTAMGRTEDRTILVRVRQR